MKSWNNWLHCKGWCYDPPGVTLYLHVEVKVFLKQVTCSKLFTTLLSSLVIFDPHSQWFLNGNQATFIIQPATTSLPCAVQTSSAHPGVSSAQPGKVWIFPSQKNSKFKYNANWQPKVLGGGSGSQGLLSHGGALAIHLLSQKRHLQLQEHRDTNQQEQTWNCAHKMHIFKGK